MSHNSMLALCVAVFGLLFSAPFTQAQTCACPANTITVSSALACLEGEPFTCEGPKDSDGSLLEGCQLVCASVPEGELAACQCPAGTTRAQSASSCIPGGSCTKLDGCSLNADNYCTAPAPADPNRCKCATGEVPVESIGACPEFKTCRALPSDCNEDNMACVLFDPCACDIENDQIRVEDESACIGDVCIQLPQCTANTRCTVRPETTPGTGGGGSIPRTPFPTNAPVMAPPPPSSAAGSNVATVLGAMAGALALALAII